MKKKRLILLFAVLLLGFFLRLVFIFSIRGLDGDNATHLAIARHTITDLVRGNYWDFNLHPFLSNVFTHYWAAISLNLYWLKLLPVLFSVGTVLIFFLIAVNVGRGSYKTALLSAFLLAVSTYNIRWAGEIKYVSTALFFNSISLLIFILIIKDFINGKEFSHKRGFFLAVVSLMAILSDYSFIWLYLVFLTFTAYLLFLGHAGLKQVKKGAAKLLFYLFAIPMLFFPWLFKFLSTLPATIPSRDYIVKPSVASILQAVFAYLIDTPGLYGIRAPETEWFIPIGNVLQGIISARTTYYVFSGLLLIAFIRKPKKFSIWNILTYFLIGIPLLFSFAVSQRTPIFIDYNLIIVHLGIILILAGYVRRTKSAGIILLLIYLLLNTLSYRVLLKYETEEDNWHRLYERMAAYQQADETVFIMYPRFVLDVLSYYEDINPQNTKMNIYDFEDIKERSDINFIKENYSLVCLTKLSPRSELRERIEEVFVYDSILGDGLGEETAMICFKESLD